MGDTPKARKGLPPSVLKQYPGHQADEFIPGTASGSHP
jgi:hypothetical protein